MAPPSDIPVEEPLPKYATRLQAPWLQHKFSLFIALIAALLLVATTVFAHALSSKSTALDWAADPTNAVRILRVLSECVSILLTILIASTTAIVMWNTASSERGITFATWLSMSPATSIIGLFKLFNWRRISDREARDWHRPWILARLSFLATVPLLSVLLTSFVYTDNLYRPLYSYPCTGGLGLYNSTYADPDYWNTNMVALSFSTYFGAVFANPSGHVLLDAKPGWARHFFTGSTDALQPSPFLFSSNFTDANALFVHQEMGIQIDLWTYGVSTRANYGDCKIWSNGLSALQLCLMSSSVSPHNLIIAGMSGCFNSTNCTSDLIWTQKLQSSITVGYWHRAADVVYSRTSGIILEAGNYSSPVPEHLVPSELLVAFDVIFGPDFSSTGSVNSPNSTSGTLINQFTGDLALAPLRIWNSDLAAMIIVPLILFQENGLYSKNQVDPSALTSKQGQPAELKMTLDLSAEQIVGVIPQWVVFIYFTGSLTLFLCCICVMILSFRIQGPPISSFELIDFSSKILPGYADSQVDPRGRTDESNISQDDSLLTMMRVLRNSDDKAIRKKLEQKRIFVREMGEKVRTIGLTGDQKEGTYRLNRTQSYS